MNSPWDLEEGFNWMHLSQRGISVCQLNGCDAERPHITAGVVRVVILLFTGYDLETYHKSDRLNNSFTVMESCFSKNTRKSASEVRLSHFLPENFVTALK